MAVGRILGAAFNGNDFSTKTKNYTLIFLYIAFTIDRDTRIKLEAITHRSTKNGRSLLSQLIPDLRLQINNPNMLESTPDTAYAQTEPDQGTKHHPIHDKEITMKNDNVATDSEAPTKRKPSGIAYSVGRIDRLLARRIRHTISPLGITVREYTALSVLNAVDQLSSAQLAERTLVSPQAANELVKAMVNKGWIKRRPDLAHKRIVQISLRKSGLRILHACDELVADLEDRILEDLSTEEKALINRQLRLIARVLMDS